MEFDNGSHQGCTENRKGIKNHPHASAAAGRSLMTRYASIIPLL
jgi:hypothetical protein